jgi:CheY-like chemotaxis protein
LYECLSRCREGPRGDVFICQETSRPAAAGSAPLDAHILLAEDNLVNQEVSVGMLTGLGCTIDVVANGLEAVQAVSRAPYDLVFMDCQMPEMDGFEATRRIRAWEARQSGPGHAPPRIPIVALTANAITGDRERCLAAGMDDYVSKPFTQAQLHETIARWTGVDTDSSTATPAADSPPSGGSPAAPIEASATSGGAVEGGPLDPSALQSIREIESSSGQPLVARVIDAYLQESPEILSQLRQVIQSGDAAKLRQLAHKWKSSNANLGAHGLAARCKRLEELGASGSTEGAPALLSELDAEYEAVCKSLLAEKLRT